MSYSFAGYFARPIISQPPVLPSGSVWREVSAPFKGVGVLLPEWVGESPSAVDVRGLAKKLGLDKAETWLYLTYDCWAGGIDYVYGLSVRGDVLHGPVKGADGDVPNAHQTYTELMEQWGVSPEDAHSFAPFDRGFWGEIET